MKMFTYYTYLDVTHTFLFYFKNAKFFEILYKGVVYKIKVNNRINICRLQKKPYLLKRMFRRLIGLRVSLMICVGAKTERATQWTHCVIEVNGFNWIDSYCGWNFLRHNSHFLFKNHRISFSSRATSDTYPWTRSRMFLCRFNFG